MHASTAVIRKKRCAAVDASEATWVRVRARVRVRVRVRVKG